MTPSESRIERNKERILRAALELFKVHGLKKTTTGDIASKAGLSPATVFNHFGSKDELVRATIEYFMAAILDDFSRIFKEDIPFIEKMEKVIFYKSDMLGSYQGDFMQAIISEDPEIRQVVDAIYQQSITGMVYNFYEEGRQQGYVNPELSTVSIMRYMMVIRSGMAAESLLSEDPEQNRKVMQELAPLCLYGIMGKPLK